MNRCRLIVISFILIVSVNYCTIDINKEELIYLANHLTLGECRKLVAYAHYLTYDLPLEQDEAEHKISKDESCLELLEHWNSEKGEGKGETHEVLEQRLRQMEKNELADWLGRTVFRELGQDLNKSLKEGFNEILNNTSTVTEQEGPTIAPPMDESEPTEWLPIDTFLYVLAIMLAFTACGMCVMVIYSKCKPEGKPIKPQYLPITNEISDDDDDAEQILYVKGN